MVLFAGVLDPEGPAAREIDDLWVLMLVLGAAVFALVVVLLAMGLRRTGGDTPVGEPLGQSRSWLLGGGVALPAVGVGVVLAATLFAMQDTEEVAAGGVTIEVIGNQWWWEFRYAEPAFSTAGELHIPAGEPVQLRITSSDVIHSFWVPSLAGKLDALPDDVTTLIIEADHPGRYDGRCAEFCGLQHAAMDLTVVAHAPDDYAAWLDDQAEPAGEPSGTEARRGASLFDSAGCSDCHTIRGTTAHGQQAPDLTHVASRELLAGGRLRATADELRAWIHDPGEFKAGVDMPAADLADDDIAAIVAYLRELE